MNEVSKYFVKDNIFLDVNVKTKEELFDIISVKAKSLGVTNNTKKLAQSFSDRESEYTTGFEDGFAIPHAVSKYVKEITVMFYRLSNGINWPSMDGNPTNIAIVLMIPKAKAASNHMDILSNIATNLIEEDFRNKLKKGTVDEIYEAFIEL